MTERGARTILGIMGGMGAKAGAFFYDRLVDFTPAASDQEHIETVLYGNPAIPDRTEGILGRGDDPYPALLDSARVLEEAGAELIVIPCISAHYYINRLRSDISCGILSAVEETGKEVARRCPDTRRLGLLATTGTLESKLFDPVLERYSLITLPADLQESLVMGAIYGNLKAGRINEGKKQALEALGIISDLGAEAVIIGCSELPLVIGPDAGRLPLFDSMEILIKRAVALCMG